MALQPSKKNVDGLKHFRHVRMGRQIGEGAHDGVEALAREEEEPPGGHQVLRRQLAACGEGGHRYGRGGEGKKMFTKY